MSVKLVIKSATQTVEDFNLDCEVSWTIGHIKDQISELYPTKPKKESQKLIYGGKLLPDNLPLKSVLNPTHEKHIMHLVCPSVKIINKSDTKQTASTPPSFDIPSSSAAFPSVNQPMFNHQNFSGIVPGVNVAPVNTGDSFQQYLAMQQMYAQFMTQYMSQFTGGVPPVLPYGPVMSTSPVQPPQVPVPQQNVAHNPRQRVPDDDHHDYLDYLHFFSRAAVLLAILYYYSSLSRIFIVLSFFLVITMYVRLNRSQQEIQQRAVERQRNESVASQPVPADIQPSETTETASNSSLPEESLSQQTENRSFVSVLSTTVSLITAFFSSLIPSEPVPVNVN